MQHYILGPLPWGEDVLRQAYCRNFIDARKAIQEHPGFFAHKELCAIKLSLEIFLDSVSDLFFSIDFFCTDARAMEFWTRPSRSRFEKLVLSIQRGVFSAATSAMSLVDHSRRVSKKTSIKGYKERIKELFWDNEEHRFVQDLRIYISHVKMVETHWQKDISAKGNFTSFLLRRDDLLEWGKWHSLAKSFINKHPEGVDIEVLFKNYQDCVIGFHHWFHTELARVSDPALSEYQHYERLLNRVDAKASWKIILNQIVRGRLDPFNYLYRYLTKEELDEVLSMPMRTKAQIDQIIKIVDEYEACDTELRNLIYEAFGLDIPDNNI